MTEKRFVNKGKDIFQYGEWWCSAGGEHCADVIATAINELIEENEQLKKQLKCSREEADDYCEELMGKDEFVRLYKRQRDDALKENKQLKADNNRLVNETAKVVAEHQRKVFELIEKKINLLENDYEKAVKSGMPSNSVYGEIELLEELKKELQE